MTDATKVIQAVGRTVQADLWANRNRYGWAVTAALLAILAGAVFLDKPIIVISQLVALVICLVMLAPTASQFGKWLAQVAAIRNGTRAPD